jgi:hypothetical protein
MVLPSFFPAELILWNCGSEEAKNLAGEVLRLIQIRLTRRVWENLRKLVKKIRPPDRIADSGSTTVHQLFVGTHDETFSVVAMCACNPDCSPVAINRI